MLNSLRNRVSYLSRSPKKVLLVSIQKCGTHLIQNLFKQVGLLNDSTQATGPVHLREFKKKKENTFISSHHTPADDVQAKLEEDPGSMKIIFLFRDPRDAVISWFHWVHPSNKKPAHSHMRYMQKVYSNFSDDEIIDMAISNDKLRKQEYNVLEHFYLSRVHLFHPNVLKMRFEDLIGPQGGGNRQRQLKSIKAFTDYLSITHPNYESLADSLYSKKSATFRKAQIGNYKTFFCPDQLRRFNELHGTLLSQYGYD